jgi:hypothetical protein
MYRFLIHDTFSLPFKHCTSVLEATYGVLRAEIYASTHEAPVPNFLRTPGEAAANLPYIFVLPMYIQILRTSKLHVPGSLQCYIA